MQRAGRTLDVLIKVDVGFHRCGIDPAAAGAADFVARVAGLPGLRFQGLLSHAGHSYSVRSALEAEEVAATEASLMNGLAERVRALGVPVREISVGATPTARFSVRHDGITELRPGNYIYFDRTQVALGAAAWTDCALTVLARVVTRPAPDRLILDSGSKTLTSDVARGSGNTDGYGAVMTSLDVTEPDDNLIIERLSEEHATVRVRGESRLQPGDLVRIVPNHSCPVSNMVDSAWLVDGVTVVDSLGVAARGRIA
jgi:D-serine deaminase-like pyridoxal phosphate-dependent protein